MNSTVCLVLSYSSDESICSSIQEWGKVTQWWAARNNTQHPSLSRQWGTLVFPGSQHCSLCCCSLPVHTSFFFSPSLLKEPHQVFLSLWEHKNLYIYPLIHLYKHQQPELLVSFSGPVHASYAVGNSCTFRLLKCPHTSWGFRLVIRFMLPNGLLEISCSALFPRRNSWMWKQGCCSVFFMSHNSTSSAQTAPKRGFHDVLSFKYHLSLPIVFVFLPSNHICLEILLLYFHLLYHCIVLGIANKPVKVISRYW